SASGPRAGGRAGGPTTALVPGGGAASWGLRSQPPGPPQGGVVRRHPRRLAPPSPLVTITLDGIVSSLESHHPGDKGPKESPRARLGVVGPDARTKLSADANREGSSSFPICHHLPHPQFAMSRRLEWTSPLVRGEQHEGEHEQDHAPDPSAKHDAVRGHHADRKSGGGERRRQAGECPHPVEEDERQVV